MRILVVGSGGREHAICRALATSTPKPKIYIAPGNAGTRELGENVPVAINDIERLVALARSDRIDLVIPGPELPLVLGLADRLRELGIPCVGPSGEAAKLEGSKAYMRQLAQDAGVPSPHFVTTRRHAELSWAVDAWDGLPVVKADGLASGKGVFLPSTKAEVFDIGQRLLQGELGDAGREIVLEERLVGTEASLFYACDGVVAVPLPHARDHKRINDNDQGPNTGGMGAVSPNPSITPEIEAVVRKTLIDPVLATMVNRGTPFQGFLFAGVMLTADGPKLLEFNVRLGDPETQAILPRLAPGQFLKLCEAMVGSTLPSFKLQVEPTYTCAVVLSAHGYPDTPRQGDRIFTTSGFQTNDRWLDHAGTKVRDGHILTHGGRVAAVVARAHSPESARSAAYVGVQHINYAGMHYRKDIGRSS